MNNKRSRDAAGDVQRATNLLVESVIYQRYLYWREQAHISKVAYRIAYNAQYDGVFDVDEQLRRTKAKFAACGEANQCNQALADYRAQVERSPEYGELRRMGAGMAGFEAYMATTLKL